MKKSLLIITLACLNVALLTSCEKSSPDSQSVETVSADNISNINLTVTNDNFIPLKEVSQKSIFVDKVDKKQLDEAFKNTIISTYWVGEK